ncbi:LPXTG cell wall anchor domain-containing protein [Streptococcus suis]|uniref:LPXTG cell wall anchor domain-containing protein n=1 Tax=Streptococcus suis TaxID=1307 RepID=A0A426TF64_STRSU|nr:LPXTG cell wall anchor domain-containing protein [Streptococcus suis]
MKKNQDFKGYGSIRKGIRGAVGILVLGLLFSAGQVVAADEVATEVTSDTGLTISENSITDVPEGAVVEPSISENAVAPSEPIAASDRSGLDLVNEVFVNDSTERSTDLPATVVEDRTAPELVSYTLDSAEYKAGDTVTLSVEVSDESELNYVGASFSALATKQSLFLGSSDIKKLANGNYQVTLTDVIPENRPSDVYKLSYINLADRVGNTIIRNTSEHYSDRIEPISLSVIGTETDIHPPQLISYSLDSIEYKAGDTVTLSVEVSDESELNYVGASFSALATKQSLFLGSSDIKKLANGNYQVTLTDVIPENRPSDVYKLSYINLADRVGNTIIRNTSEHYSDRIEPVEFKVHSTSSGAVIIHYQLEDGTKIAEDKRISGVVATLAPGANRPAETGITYDTSTEAPLILEGLDGRKYYKVNVDGVESGVLKQGLSEVTYTYTPYLISTEQIDQKYGRVLVQYQTPEGQSIKESVVAVPDTLVSYRERSIYIDGTESISDPISLYPYYDIFQYLEQSIELQGVIYNRDTSIDYYATRGLSEGEEVITLYYRPVPSLQSLTFDKESYKPGETVTASFIVFSPAEMERIFFGLSDNRLNLKYVLRAEENSSTVVGENLYRFDVPIQLMKSYPQAELDLDFIYLAAKNNSRSDTVSDPKLIDHIHSTFKVDSDFIMTDNEGPKILDIQFNQSEFDYGEKIIATIDVEDESEIAEVNLSFNSENGIYNFAGNIEQIEHLSGNKKRITLSSIAHFTYPEGVSNVGNIFVSDRFGNSASFSQPEESLGKFITIHPRTELEPKPIIEEETSTTVKIVDKATRRVLIRKTVVGDYQTVQDAVEEAIETYEAEYGVKFELSGAGGTGRSVVTTEDNRTHTAITRYYEQFVTNISDKPLPEDTNTLVPKGLIYDNNSVNYALFRVRVMVGDEVMSDTSQTIYSTVDEVIREILTGLDNNLYTLGSIDVKNEFTSIFTDVQIYNGPSYDILIQLKKLEMEPNQQTSPEPIETDKPNNTIINDDSDSIENDTENKVPVEDLSSTNEVGNHLDDLNEIISNVLPTNIVSIGIGQDIKIEKTLDSDIGSQITVNQDRTQVSSKSVGDSVDSGRPVLPKTGSNEPISLPIVGLSLLGVALIRRKKAR